MELLSSQRVLCTPYHQHRVTSCKASAYSAALRRVKVCVCVCGGGGGGGGEGGWCVCVCGLVWCVCTITRHPPPSLPVGESNVS